MYWLSLKNNTVSPFLMNTYNKLIMRARHLYETIDIAMQNYTLEELDKDRGERVFYGTHDVNLPDGAYEAHIKGWVAKIESPDNPEVTTDIEMDGGVRGSCKGEVVIKDNNAVITIK